MAERRPIEKEVMDFLNDPKTTQDEVDAWYELLTADELLDLEDHTLRMERGEEMTSEVPYDEANPYSGPKVLDEEGELAHERAGETIYKMPTTMSVMRHRNPGYMFRDQGEGIQYKRPGADAWTPLDPDGGFEWADVSDLQDELVEGTAAAFGQKALGSAGAALGGMTGPAAPALAPAGYAIGSALGGYLGGSSSERLRQARSREAGFAAPGDHDPSRIVASGLLGGAPLPGGSAGLFRSTEQKLLRQGLDPKNVARPYSTAIDQGVDVLKAASGGRSPGSLQMARKYVPDVIVPDSEKAGLFKNLMKSMGGSRETIPGVRSWEKVSDAPMDAATKEVQSITQEQLKAAEDHVWSEMSGMLEKAQVKVDLGGARGRIQSKIDALKDEKAAEGGFLSQTDQEWLDKLTGIRDRFFALKNKETGDVVPQELFDAKKAGRKRTSIREAIANSESDAERHVLREAYKDVTKSIDEAASYQGPIARDVVDGPVPGVDPIADLPEIAEGISPAAKQELVQAHVNSKVDPVRYENLSRQYAAIKTLRKNLESGGLVQPSFNKQKVGMNMDEVVDNRTRKAATTLTNMDRGRPTPKKQGVKQDLSILEKMIAELSKNKEFAKKHPDLKKHLVERANVVSTMGDWAGKQDILGPNKMIPQIWGGLGMGMGGSMAHLPIAMAIAASSHAAASPWLHKRLLYQKTPGKFWPAAAARAGYAAPETQGIVQPMLEGE